MKNLLFALCLILSSISIKAKNDTIYFDKSWNNCAKESAIFYRIVSKNEDKFLVKDMYINNNPQMIAICLSVEPLIKDGKCSFYNENGAKIISGNYTNNKENGLWIWWDDNGKDSTVAQFNTDGTKSFTRFSRILLNENHKSDKAFTIADKMPAFPGGHEAMTKFIAKEYHQPKIDKKAGIKGKIYISFIIDETGQVTNPIIRRSLATNSDEEAIRVITKMPRWEAGENDGKAVKVEMTVPIAVD